MIKTCWISDWAGIIVSLACVAGVERGWRRGVRARSARRERAATQAMSVVFLSKIHNSHSASLFIKKWMGYRRTVRETWRNAGERESILLVGFMLYGIQDKLPQRPQRASIPSLPSTRHLKCVFFVNFTLVQCRFVYISISFTLQCVSEKTCLQGHPTMVFSQML